MPHQLTGTFALDRLSEDAQADLFGGFDQSGVKHEISNNGSNVTVTGDRESFELAKAKYNKAIAVARQSETDESRLALLEEREERAAQRAAEAKGVHIGTLMSNPEAMQAGIAQRGMSPHEVENPAEGEQVGDVNLPANSPPPGYTPGELEGETSAEYLADQAERRQQADQGQLNSGITDPQQQVPKDYTPPQPEQA